MTVGRWSTEAEPFTPGGEQGRGMTGGVLREIGMGTQGGRGEGDAGPSRPGGGVGRYQVQEAGQ